MGRLLGLDSMRPRHEVSGPCSVKCIPLWVFTVAGLLTPSLTQVDIPVSPILQTALISVGCDLEKKIVIQK